MATACKIKHNWTGTTGGCPRRPRRRKRCRRPGLTLGFLNDLILRTLYMRGGMLGLDLARFLCLPFKVIEESLQLPQGREVHRGDRRRPDRPRQLPLQPDRAGPPPRPGRDEAVRLRRPRPGAARGLRRADLSPGGHRHRRARPEPLRAAFCHLVISDELFNAIGPAIVSGKSVFIYGPPGNGKTSIARSIGDFMNNAGGEIYVPYAFLAENSIITVYDQAVHQRVDGDGDDRLEDNEATIRRLLNTGTVDPRWVRIRRPVIVTGGELNLDMLDLRYNAEANFYQAPLHVKANGGVFLIDDFGRQLCSPKELLNRWILPLEDRHDFLTVASGKKFEVPFEQLIIFSTNLDPKDLVDDAFLRRIRHKVEINAPDARRLREDLQQRASSGWA